VLTALSPRGGDRDILIIIIKSFSAIIYYNYVHSYPGKTTGWGAITKLRNACSPIVTISLAKQQQHNYNTLEKVPIISTKTKVIYSPTDYSPGEGNACEWSTSESMMSDGLHSSD
jgi:hypothetical protein